MYIHGWLCCVVDVLAIHLHAGLVSLNGVLERFIDKTAITFYQDRLGTNIGKTPKKDHCFSSG
jgi:hypothetical protein